MTPVPHPAAPTPASAMPSARPGAPGHSPEPEAHWTPLVDGRRLTLLAPEPERITIDTIAYGLAGQYRWGGQSRPRVTVAEHSCLAAQLAEALRLGPRMQGLALLHDAAEGLGLHDVTTPVKDLVPGHRVLEDLMQAAVWQAMNVIPPRGDEVRFLKTIDAVVTATECRVLFDDADDPAWGFGDARPNPDIRLMAWPPAVAEVRFLAAWDRLEGDRA